MWFLFLALPYQAHRVRILKLESFKVGHLSSVEQRSGLLFKITEHMQLPVKSRGALGSHCL